MMREEELLREILLTAQTAAPLMLAAYDGSFNKYQIGNNNTVVMIKDSLQYIYNKYP